MISKQEKKMISKAIAEDLKLGLNGISLKGVKLSYDKNMANEDTTVNIGVRLGDDYLFNINSNDKMSDKSKYIVIEIKEYNVNSKLKKEFQDINKAFANNTTFYLTANPNGFDKLNLNPIVKDGKYRNFLNLVIDAIKYFANPTANNGYYQACKKLNNLYKYSKFMILTGPPGTGKTHIAKRLAARILGIDLKGKKITFDSDYDDNKEIFFSDIDNHELAKQMEKLRFSSRKSEDRYKGAWEIVQFHPSYTREDFIQGIKVETGKGNINYEIKNRILVEMVMEALIAYILFYDSSEGLEDLKRREIKDLIKKYRDIRKFNEIANRNPEVRVNHELGGAIGEEKGPPRYVLIIDEINRALLSAVLGELIYGLEYRNEKIKSLYFNEDKDYDFFIPENFYIVGTMNTADFSLETLDYAVRRRFAFFQCPSDKELLERYYVGNKSNLLSFARDLYTKVEEFFYREGYCTSNMNREDFMIGHTYFMAEDEEELIFKAKYKVLPLLKEYLKDGILTAKAGEKIKEMEKNSPRDWKKIIL